MTNPNIVKAQILVRSGSNGTQAMWVAYSCPKTGKPMTAWGTVKTPEGDKRIFNPGSRPHVSLVFSNSKEASQNDLNKLYTKKLQKYEALGTYEIDVRRLRADPLGTDAQAAANNQQRSAAARNDGDATLKPGKPKKAPLPREITHPEAVKGGSSASGGWFF